MRTLVLIADDGAALRAIRLALRQSAGFRVIATLDGRVSARAALTELAPDVILVDEMCQRSNAVARVREAGDASPGSQVILLGRAADATLVRHGFGAGAQAVICRTLPPATLAVLLTEVVRGNVAHPQPIERVGRPTDARMPALRLVAGHELPEARTIA